MVFDNIVIDNTLEASRLILPCNQDVLVYIFIPCATPEKVCGYYKILLSPEKQQSLCPKEASFPHSVVLHG